ncbi:MAG: hypothetical protein NZ870_01485, partial [bacterium]|nr:hypothetical protein [bacterium]
MIEDFIKSIESLQHKFRDFISKKNIEKNIKDDILREHLWHIEDIKEKFLKIKEVIKEKEAYFEDERNTLRKLIGVDEDKLKAKVYVLEAEALQSKRLLSKRDAEIAALKNEIRGLEGRLEVLTKERDMLVERIQELEAALNKKFIEEFAKFEDIKKTVKAEIESIEKKILDIEEKIKSDVIEVERIKQEELKTQHLKHLKELQNIILEKAGFFSNTLDRIMLGYLRKIRVVLASASGGLMFWIEIEFYKVAFMKFKVVAGVLKKRIDS